MSANVQFDESAIRHSTSKTSEGSVLTSILRAAQVANLDPVAELYNEALELAKDGHFGPARARLQVLLGLAPSDGDAHLLLAKVYVAGQQWRRAISTLDEATQCGAHVPEALRDAVVRHLQHDMDEDEDDRSTRQVREQGELKKLRSEVRRLRSEHAHLSVHMRDREKEAVKWMWIATASSLLAIGFIGWLSLGSFVSTPSSSATAEVLPAPSVEPEGALPLPVDDAVVRDPGLKSTVEQALAAAGLPDVQAIVRGTTASLSGVVPSHAASREAAELVAALPGIDVVDTDALVNVAARDGTTYVVRPGDSLSVIAVRMYGDQLRVDAILAANAALGGKPNLQIGQELTIPPVR